jgi:hypothetical protein
VVQVAALLQTPLVIEMAWGKAWLPRVTKRRRKIFGIKATMDEDLSRRGRGRDIRKV